MIESTSLTVKRLQKVRYLCDHKLSGGETFTLYIVVAYRLSGVNFLLSINKQLCDKNCLALTPFPWSCTGVMGPYKYIYSRDLICLIEAKEWRRLHFHLHFCYPIFKASEKWSHYFFYNYPLSIHIQDW